MVVVDFVNSQQPFFYLLAAREIQITSLYLQESKELSHLNEELMLLINVTEGNDGENSLWNSSVGPWGTPTG